jgi:Putative phage replication protein RstA
VNYLTVLKKGDKQLYENLGLKVKEMRSELKISQAKLAKEVGITREWLLKVENGRVIASPQLEAKLLKSLEMMKNDSGYNKESSENQEGLEKAIDFEFIKDLKSTREEYMISQDKLASVCDITRSWLNKVENGKVVVSEELKELLLTRLEFLNPNNQREVIFDYVRIRFPITDVAYVIEEILNIRFRHFNHLEFGFYKYKNHCSLGDIIVLYSDDIEMGVLLELKGQGCRQFESYLYAQERTWLQFFEECIRYDAIFKRIDLAINDKVGFLDIAKLANKCHRGECISVFRSFRDYKSSDLTTNMEKQGMGATLYIGSLKSEVYFCVYEKDYEQYIKYGIDVSEAEIKNRFELRLKNDRAERAIHDFVTYNDLENTIYAIINRYMRFVDRIKGVPREDWPINKDWAYFMGDLEKKLRLTIKPEPYTIEKTFRWLDNQVLSSYKMVERVEEINGTDYLKQAYENAVLSKKHLTIIENATISTNEAVTRRAE